VNTDMQDSSKTLWSEVREVRAGVQKLVRRIPPQYELAIHRIRSRYNPMEIRYSRDPVAIARWVEQYPHDEFLVEADLVPAGSQEVHDAGGYPERRSWAACFLIEVSNVSDPKETRGRLLAATCFLTLSILRRYPKILPYIIQGNSSLWCLYFDPGLAALPVCSSVVVQERIKSTAQQALDYLHHGSYSILPVNSFVMPKTAAGWDLKHSEIQAILSQRHESERLSV